MAVANYEDTYGQFPPAYIADDSGRPMHSWRVLILPFIEQRELYYQYDFSQPWNSERNLRLATQMPSIYALDGEYNPGAVTTNYLAVVGPLTAWPGSSCHNRETVTDEHSATIHIVENLGQNVHWMEPRDLSFESMSFKINDPNGINSNYDAPAVTTLDGSVCRLEAQMPENVLRAMLTATGGERVTSDGNTWRFIPDGRLRPERGPVENAGPNRQGRTWLTPTRLAAGR